MTTQARKVKKDDSGSSNTDSESLYRVREVSPDRVIVRAAQNATEEELEVEL